jgi:hypothetical protein
MGWLDDFRRRQAVYVASMERIADAHLAIVENKLLEGGDPSRHPTLLAAYQEALNYLLDIGEHTARSDNYQTMDMEINCSVME